MIANQCRVCQWMPSPIHMLFKGAETKLTSKLVAHCKKYLKLLRGLFYEGWKSGVAKVFSSPKNSARDSKKSSPEKRKSSP